MPPARTRDALEPRCRRGLPPRAPRSTAAPAPAAAAPAPPPCSPQRAQPLLLGEPTARRRRSAEPPRALARRRRRAGCASRRRRRPSRSRSRRAASCSRARAWRAPARRRARARPPRRRPGRAAPSAAGTAGAAPGRPSAAVCLHPGSAASSVDAQPLRMQRTAEDVAAAELQRAVVVALAERVGADAAEMFRARRRPGWARGRFKQCGRLHRVHRRREVARCDHDAAAPCPTCTCLRAARTKALLPLRPYLRRMALEHGAKLHPLPRVRSSSAPSFASTRRPLPLVKRLAVRPAARGARRRRAASRSREFERALASCAPGAERSALRALYDHHARADVDSAGGVALRGSRFVVARALRQGDCAARAAGADRAPLRPPRRGALRGTTPAPAAAARRSSGGRQRRRRQTARRRRCLRRVWRSGRRRVRRSRSCRRPTIRTAASFCTPKPPTTPPSECATAPTTVAATTPRDRNRAAAAAAAAAAARTTAALKQQLAAAAAAEDFRAAAVLQKAIAAQEDPLRRAVADLNGAIGAAVDAHGGVRPRQAASATPRDARRRAPRGKSHCCAPSAPSPCPSNGCRRA